MRRHGILVAVLALMAGCSGITLDPSMSAVAAGDPTLPVSACAAVPGRGMDVCHVKENTNIEASWTLFVPYGDKTILGGEIDVYYRDLHKSYGITGKTVVIPWADFFGQTKWTRDMDGEALALASIRFLKPDGIEEIVNFRGIAKIVVTREGYDRLPIDSGFAAWSSSCKIEYSTAGRSAVKCK